MKDNFKHRMFIAKHYCERDWESFIERCENNIPIVVLSIMFLGIFIFFARGCYLGYHYGYIFLPDNIVNQLPWYDIVSEGVTFLVSSIGTLLGMIFLPKIIAVNTCALYKVLTNKDNYNER